MSAPSTASTNPIRPGQLYSKSLQIVYSLLDSANEAKSFTEADYDEYKELCTKVDVTGTFVHDHDWETPEEVNQERARLANQLSSNEEQARDLMRMKQWLRTEGTKLSSNEGTRSLEARHAPIMIRLADHLSSYCDQMIASTQRSISKGKSRATSQAPEGESSVPPEVAEEADTIRQMSNVLRNLSHEAASRVENPPPPVHHPPGARDHVIGWPEPPAVSSIQSVGPDPSFEVPTSGLGELPAAASTELTSKSNEAASDVSYSQHMIIFWAAISAIDTGSDKYKDDNWDRRRKALAEAPKWFRDNEPSLRSGDYSHPVEDDDVLAAVATTLSLDWDDFRLTSGLMGNRTVYPVEEPDDIIEMRILAGQLDEIGRERQRKAKRAVRKARKRAESKSSKE